MLVVSSSWGAKFATCSTQLSHLLMTFFFLFISYERLNATCGTFSLSFFTCSRQRTVFSTKYAPVVHVTTKGVCSKMWGVKSSSQTITQAPHIFLLTRSSYMYSTLCTSELGIQYVNQLCGILVPIFQIS